MNLKELIKAGATIVDVRTADEFSGGHVVGSINIPLNEIPARLNEFKSMKNIIVCCASGGRSKQAEMLLKHHGIPSTDGGPWIQVNAFC